MMHLIGGTLHFGGEITPDSLAIPMDGISGISANIAKKQVILTVNGALTLEVSAFLETVPYLQ
jgi:hypothetical protein